MARAKRPVPPHDDDLETAVAHYNDVYRHRIGPLMRWSLGTSRRTTPSRWSSAASLYLPGRACCARAATRARG